MKARETQLLEENDSDGLNNATTGVFLVDGKNFYLQSDLIISNY